MCTICDLRIEFGTSHPMGLSIAVATRRGIDAALLPEPGAPWDRQGAIGLMHGVQQRLERVLNPAALRALPGFFVLLVETRTWAWFQPGETGFDTRARRDPPDAFEAAPAEPMIVAAETALAPMLEGRLPFARARDDGMMLLDARDAARDMLEAAWSRSWPVSGFSRFVCA
jgi:hypothetical protein